VDARVAPVGSGRPVRLALPHKRLHGPARSELDLLALPVLGREVGAVDLGAAAVCWDWGDAALCRGARWRRPVGFAVCR
jgi:hypothetical protein